MQFPCSSRSATKQQQIIWKTKQNRTKTRKWKLVVKKNLCYRSLVLRNTFVGPNVEKAWGSLRSAVWAIKTLLKLLLLISMRIFQNVRDVMVPLAFSSTVVFFLSSPISCTKYQQMSQMNKTVKSESSNSLWGLKPECNTVEPPCAITSRKQPPPISDSQSKTPKVSPSKPYSWSL